jgi:hypothetical protein
MYKISFLIFLFLLGCNESQNKYTVIDRRAMPSGDTAYVVYTPDTNWTEMEQFAKMLLKNNRKWSGVAFFNPREKALKLNTDFSIPNESWGYIVATYRYDEDKGYFTFNKSINRFRKDMKFKPSAKLDK